MLFFAEKRFVTELFVVDDKFNNGTTGVCCVIFSPLPSLLFTVDVILKNDYSVWLKWDKETLTSRLTKSKKRPITYSLKKNDLIKLIEKRAKIYSLAKFKINCDKLSKQEIAKKILEIYEK